jgi:predicted nucleotidyltransferase
MILIPLEQQHLDELVRRIVEAVHPLKIILFGSAARGEMGPDSDVDVMVVMPEGTNQLHLAQHLRAHLFLFDLPFAVDIIVATPEQLKRYKDDIGFVYFAALKEGKEIYVVAA